MTATDALKNYLDGLGHFLFFCFGVTGKNLLGVVKRELYTTHVRVVLTNRYLACNK